MMKQQQHVDSMGSSRWRTRALGMAVVLLVGCGDGDLTINVRKPAGERPDIDPALASTGKLSIPAGTPFNYSSYRSGRSGESGTAEGDAALYPDGASCSAEARDGGSSWGEFQLGYCFDNASGVPLDAAVTLRLTSRETASGEPGTGDAASSSTSAQSVLRFFIKDTNGLVVKKEVLISGDLETGADASGATHELVFDARFEPNIGYYLVLAGRSEAKAGAGQSASTSLRATQYSINVAWNGRSTAEADASPDEAEVAASGSGAP